MKWAKMVAKFDPYSAMINRGHDSFDCARSPIVYRTYGECCEPNARFAYLAFETLFKFFCFILSIYIVYDCMDTVSMNSAQNVLYSLK